jgi:hypothetical protein
MLETAKAAEANVKVNAATINPGLTSMEFLLCRLSGELKTKYSNDML